MNKALIEYVAIDELNHQEMHFLDLSIDNSKAPYGVPVWLHQKSQSSLP